MVSVKLVDQVGFGDGHVVSFLFELVESFFSDYFGT